MGSGRSESSRRDRGQGKRRTAGTANGPLLENGRLVVVATPSEFAYDPDFAGRGLAERSTSGYRLRSLAGRCNLPSRGRAGRVAQTWARDKFSRCKSRTGTVIVFFRKFQRISVASA